MPKGTNNIADYNNQLTAAQRKENAQKAGAASGKKRTQLRLWRESVNHFMAGELSKDDEKRIREKYGLDESLDLTQQDKVVAAMTAKAQAGDKDAAQFLRDTAGQRPDIVYKLGNAEDKPFEMIDLGSLSDDQLRKLAEREAPSE